MIPPLSGKPELAENDPEKLGQLLDLELVQKRAEWKRASGRYRNIRTVSFLFLFFLIVGGLLAFFLVFSRVNEERATQHSPTVSSAPGR